MRSIDVLVQFDIGDTVRSLRGPTVGLEGPIRVIGWLCMEGRTEHVAYQVEFPGYDKFCSMQEDEVESA